LNIRGSFESTFEAVGVACFDGVMKVRILLHCKFNVYEQEQPYEAQGKDAASEKRRRDIFVMKGGLHTGTEEVRIFGPGGW
jgi:hypothetical protein